MAVRQIKYKMLDKAPICLTPEHTSDRSVAYIETDYTELKNEEINNHGEKCNKSF